MRSSYESSSCQLSRTFRAVQKKIFHQCAQLLTVKSDYILPSLLRLKQQKQIETLKRANSREKCLGSFMCKASFRFEMYGLPEIVGTTLSNILFKGNYSDILLLYRTHTSSSPRPFVELHETFFMFDLTLIQCSSENEDFPFGIPHAAR